MTNPLVLIASSLRLQQIALQPLSNFSSDHFSISEYRRQLDHMGLKAAAMKKLILVYRYVQTTPCCIYRLVYKGVLTDEHEVRIYSQLWTQEIYLSYLIETWIHQTCSINTLGVSVDICKDNLTLAKLLTLHIDQSKHFENFILTVNILLEHFAWLFY